MEKGEILEARIEDYTAEGQGVARVDGRVVFVPNAIAGELCRVRIEKVGKTWASGKMTELLERSPHRIDRDCPVAKLCGGCDFRHMDYVEECRLKSERVRQALNRIGGENLEKMPILPAPTCEGYRNKAQYPVSAEKGRLYAGFFRAGTHRVIENQRCRILPEETDRVKDIVVRHANRSGVSAYDEIAHKGLLRHIFVRRGAVSGEILVCLVINGTNYPKTGALIDALKAVPGFTTLVLNHNTKKGNTVLGPDNTVLYGPGFITDTLCGLTFRLSPHSFYQVNHHQAEKLYEAAIAQAGITKADRVLDLYCGAGTITLIMARVAGAVLGVEVVPQAVEDARENARRNGIENAEFFCGDAGEAAAMLAKKGEKIDVVVVDPPRKGLSPETAAAVAAFAPRKLVYVSCDPATLARDIARLKELGFHLKSAQTVDLFPRCAHIETVVLLSKGEIDSKKVRVEFSLEDMDMSEFQDGATYPQIKEYVLEHTGLKVSNLYISQIKRKCGLEVGKNYNLPKSEDSRQPQCPPEKEKAIREAFKYFGMI